MVGVNAAAGKSTDGEGSNRPCSDITDDGAVLVNLNLSSAFSVSTSSTSNFVEVDANSEDYASTGISSKGRRLRKRPPVPRTTPPCEILARSGYSHSSSAPSSVASSEKHGYKKIAERLGMLKPDSLDDQWVLVDLEQTVTVKQSLV